MKIKRICKFCGKEFYINSCYIKYGRGKFCSLKCRAQYWRKKNSGKNSPLWKRQKCICKTCGKEFYAKQCDIKRGSGKYCSKNCWKMDKKASRIAVCKNCGKIFIKKRKESKFCSIVCVLEWRRKTKFYSKLKRKSKKIKRTCKLCKKTFYVFPRTVKRGGGIFCSRKCAGKWQSENKIRENAINWRGGKSFEPYGMEFNNKLKKKIRERDNYTCQECGMTEKELGYKLHIHHIDYDKKNNNPDNLISLCRSCHLQTNFKREDWTKYFQGKIRKTVRGG